MAKATKPKTAAKETSDKKKRVIRRSKVGLLGSIPTSAVQKLLKKRKAHATRATSALITEMISDYLDSILTEVSSILRQEKRSRANVNDVLHVIANRMVAFPDLIESHGDAAAAILQQYHDKREKAKQAAGLKKPSAPNALAVRLKALRAEAKQLQGQLLHQGAQTAQNE